MITRKDIERLQSDVTYKASIVGQTNNAKTRKDFDDAVENLIKAEKEYNQQRKTKIIEYSIGTRPTGDYKGQIEIWEDANNEEIKKAIFDDCEFSYYYEYK
jgi:hypothetical protein